MIAFDATILLLLLYPGTNPPLDDGGNPVDKAQERLQYLVTQLSKQNEKILIPTPALSEILVHAGDAMGDYLNILHKKSCFRIADFDERAAIEVALLAAKDRLSKKKKAKKKDRAETVAKIKYDRQIAAIAKVENATALYTDDSGLSKIAIHLGLKVIRTVDLPLPPEDAQLSLQLDVPDAPAEEE